jgi:hypothetical protein
MVSSSARQSSVRHAEIRNATLPMDARIQIERNGDRLLVVIERRQRRAFALSLDEAAYLCGLLAKELPPVTVTHAEGGR